MNKYLHDKEKLFSILSNLQTNLSEIDLPKKFDCHNILLQNFIMSPLPVI